MTVYVLHFEPPYKHAKHYNGDGSPLVKAAKAKGREIILAHVFEGPLADRNFERRLKRRKDVCQWCPICGRSRAFS